MRKTIPVLLTSGLVLAGCGGWSDSNLNPTNWFGRSTSAPVEASVDPNVNPLIPDSDAVGLFSRPEGEQGERPLIETVTDLTVDRTPSGAIVRATGIAFRQGAYDAILLPVQEEDGETSSILTLEFTVVYPESGTPQGSERSRTITAARTVSLQDLQSISSIRVIAKQNVRESRRR